jgi:hypothetical protein
MSWPRSAAIPLGLFACTLVAAAISFHEMGHVPALLFIAPGYLVQSWLFVTHHALGGLGYQATVVGVSAGFWTVLVLVLAWLVRSALRRVRGRRAP